MTDKQKTEIYEALQEMQQALDLYRDAFDKTEEWLKQQELALAIRERGAP